MTRCGQSRTILSATIVPAQRSSRVSNLAFPMLPQISPASLFLGVSEYAGASCFAPSLLSASPARPYFLACSGSQSEAKSPFEHQMVLAMTVSSVMVVVKPVVHGIGINPEGEFATVNQRPVVLRPIGDGGKRLAHDADLKERVVIRSPAS